MSHLDGYHRYVKISRKKSESIRSKNFSPADTPNSTLTKAEKIFLLSAERGDCASVQGIIQEYSEKSPEFNINCLDPLNRNALIIGIEKENIDLINLLLKSGIEIKDSLLHAINEEYVEGVEVLLEWEEKNHVPGQLHSWESVNKSPSTFTLDITPLILAAHKNNYEILKLLLDKGATLPVIHDIQCGCEECVLGREYDTLRHVRARLNAYKAQISPSLICLTSKDPLLTAIELYGELKRLERLEPEFRIEYNSMRRTVQTFATSLLDHIRTSEELEILLNYDAKGDPWEPNDRQTLSRLKLAMKYRLKMFVVHPNVQHLLASLWYEGLPEFKRKNIFHQIVDIIKIALMFVLYSLAYILCPSSAYGKYLRKPLVKFICDSTAYVLFLGFLILSSQRVERLYYILLGITTGEEFDLKERGALPGIVECIIIIYFLGILLKEIRTLYVDGVAEYTTDLWNILDFITNTFYITWISLRFTAVLIVSREYEQGYDPWYTKDKWDNFDPHMVSEMCYTSAMILSFMKLVKIFSINPHLGALQICLGRMIIDVIKFFSLYALVLLAFGCGMNQLLWYFAALEEQKCYHNNDGIPDYEKEDKACTIWRRFANLFEASQSLYWASFGLVDLTVFDLTGLKGVLRFWCLLFFGCYCAVNVILLLNMLIAMLSSSYQIISERADNEWKFARSQLFVNFFEKEDILPAPFNLIPTVKSVVNLFRKKIIRKSVSHRKELCRERADLRYDVVMQLLVRRYVTLEQKKLEEFAVTEEDIAEVRHDISKLRFELRDIFQENNFVIPKGQESRFAQGKKERFIERRIIKNFQIGMVEGVVNEIISTEKVTKNIFGRIAKALGKKDWITFGRESTIMDGSLVSSASLIYKKLRQQDLNNYILECTRDSSTMELDPGKLVEYKPQLIELNPKARIAYAKFKRNILKKNGSQFNMNQDNITWEEDLTTSQLRTKKNKKRMASSSFDSTVSKTEIFIIPTPKPEKSRNSDTIFTDDTMPLFSDCQTKSVCKSFPSVQSSPVENDIKSHDDVVITMGNSVSSKYPKGTRRDGNWL